MYICLNGKFTDLEREAKPPLSYLFVWSVCVYACVSQCYRGASNLMIRDLFVFFLNPLMILERETGRKGSIVYKQSGGDRRSEGVGFT